MEKWLQLQTKPTEGGSLRLKEIELLLRGLFQDGINPTPKQVQKDITPSNLTVS